jgi:eukaryotic-like serine/threonine-protein kinase
MADPDLDDELRRARPAQDDPIGRQLEARLRAKVTGVEPAPAQVGRFTLLEVVGSGGMGVVYAAHDPTLDRKVAIKQLHVADERARARVLAEARSLAKLSHPNVVAVYEASVAGDELYLVMELVAGVNLRRHLAEARPDARAILAIFVDVGRGVAAAHAAGIVHGDLKPENILVGERGAKVVDFGLARGPHAPLVELALPSDGGAGASVRMGGRLGRPADARAAGSGGGASAAGTRPPVGGTPAYMAPAQLAGAAPDAASDQFAFAAALYEALAGERPYAAAHDLAEQARAVRAGPPPPLAGVAARAPGDSPRASGVSARVSAVIARALAADPAARFASVDALVAELAAELVSPPPRRSRAGVAVVVGFAGVAVTAAVVFVLAARSRGPTACDTSADRLARLWPARFDRVGVDVAGILRGYGERWSAMAAEACVATDRGEQSTAMLDRRMACLDRRLDELGALAADLANAPPATPAAIARAKDAAYGLSPLDPCADRAQLADVEPPAPAVAGDVRALRRRLDSARGRQKTRESAAALADATAIVADARGTGYEPVLADALLVQGQLSIHTGQLAPADAQLAEAAKIAAAARDDLTLARAFAARAYIANEKSEFAEALAFADAAAAAASRIRGGDLVVAQIHSYRGEAQAGLGRFDDAHATITLAIQTAEAARDAGRPLLGEELDHLAAIETRQGAYAEAEATARRAIEILTAAYGPEHIDVASAMNTLAGVRAKLGDLPAAIAIYRDVLRVDRAVVGEDHFYTAIAHGNLGDALRRHGDYADAATELAAALATWEKTTGLGTATAINTLSGLARLALDTGALADAEARLADVLARRIALYGEIHVEVADTLNDLGNVAKDRGDAGRATDLYQRALVTYERALGPDHPRVPIALSNLGEAAILAKDYARATASCTRALALDEKALGADHPDLAYDLQCLGEAALGARDRRSARAHLERALALREHAGGDPAELARTRAALAKAK